MRLLFSARHRKSLEPYFGFLRTMTSRGHAVTVTLQERDEKADRALGALAGVTVSPFPSQRRDDWADAAGMLRTARDFAQYLRPPYRRARKLRARALQRLLDHVEVNVDARAESVDAAALSLPPRAAERLAAAAEVVERAIPASRPHIEFLRAHRPDAILVSPLVHFGAAQAELVKAARTLGVPVAMHVFSWDNLSTKGALHVFPDHVFAWNDTQRRELDELHGFPSARVSLVGATRFDEFIARTSALSDAEYHRSLGLDPSRPTILYLCSSKLVADREAGFIRDWLRALRASPLPIRDANVVLRPHPDVPTVEDRWITGERAVRWEAAGADLQVCELFDDARTLFVRSDRGSGQTLYEMLTHAAAVVGLNTSAEIEAGILGRPVLTVVVDERVAGGQQTTLHFEQLHQAHGGFVTAAATLDEHLVQLDAVLRNPPDQRAIRARVAAFIRPCGWQTPAGDVLADALEAHATGAARGPAAPAPAVGRAIDDESDERFDVCGEPVRLGAVSRSSASADLADGRGVTAAWLCEATRPGEIVADVGAGLGLAAIAVVRQRGATVYAFEPAIATLDAAWRLVQLNQCAGAVVLLPLLPGPRAMLRQDVLASSSAGARRSTPRRHQWREHDAGRGDEVIQPVLAVTLDAAMKLWSLPVPAVLRIALGDATADCVAGAESCLQQEGLRTVIVQAPARSYGKAVERLLAHGYAMSEERDAAASTAAEVCSRWQRRARL